VSVRVTEIGPEVIEACRRGDREAFRSLYETYKDRVYSVACYALGGDAASAADVTQQVFVKLLTNLSKYRGEARFSTWLHRLVVNICLDRRRAARTHPVPTDPAILDAIEHPRWRDSDVERADEARAVHGAIAQLPAHFRLVVLLRYFEELSYEDIAAALNCSVGTVASRLNRAHRLLAKRLAPGAAAIGEGIKGGGIR
jgi:RNA polymerase sigma-70 factor (ECF subfamily)